MSLSRLQETWEELGRTDPLWAVLVRPERRDGRWPIDEFLATGREHVAEIRTRLSHWGSDLGGRVLDFGCGVGRLSNALADYANDVVGVDISRSMIAKADDINTDPSKVRFVHYDGTRLPFADNTFDSAVSLISIQHSPPEVQIGCLVELHRVVRPGGVLAMQIPVRPTHATPLDPAGMRTDIQLLSVPRELQPKQRAQARLRVTNRSELEWPVESRVQIGNHWYRDEKTEIWDDGRMDLPLPMKPGGTVEVTLPFTAPPSPGRYDIEFDLVQEMVTWWADHNNRTVRLPVEVTNHISDPPGAPSAPVMAATHGRNEAGMEMYGMDPTLVSMIFAHIGGSTLGTVPDTLAGDGWESCTYYIQA